VTAFEIFDSHNLQRLCHYMTSSPATASLSVLVLFDGFTTWVATLSCCRYWLLTQLSALLYRMCKTNVHLRFK